mmetsp:Transcript_831/g.1066  ORF Transcript_831/g.1066 Transcript_831/m.1066 type:complete len:357 (+) Transcript_831:86-1156(+)
MVMTWSRLLLAPCSLTVFAAAFGSGNHLHPSSSGPVSTDIASDTDDNLDEVSFLQSSVANHHKHSRPDAHEFAFSAATANEKDMLLFLQRRGEPTWPQPGDPSFQITPGHRLTVLSFKSAVAAQNVEAINRTVVQMALLPVKLDIEQGVYPLIFSVLHDYQDDRYQYVQQNAWRGLSDQSGTALGAPHIANYGGPSKGIEYMVHQMQAHPEPYYALCADHLTLKYEILACMSGLLSNDQDNVWGPAAVREGLLDQILYTMRAEPDLIASQTTACRVMGLLLWRNPHYIPLLKEKGALEVVQRAVERFEDGDDTPFHFGFTMGKYYNVTQGCGYSRYMLLGEEPVAAMAKYAADMAR